MTTELTGAALLSQRHSAPIWLIERSAAARAKASQSTVETVLDEWVQRVDSPDEADSAQPTADSPKEAASDQPPAASPTEAAPSPSSPSGGGAAEGVGGGQTLTGAALLTAVAAARGMPETLIERSAQARAGAAGFSLEDVLHEWAEEEGLEPPTPPKVHSPQPATHSPKEAAPSSSSPSGGSAGEGGGGGQALTGAALLTAVAAARGMPESLVERSAAARAKKTDGTVEDVLNEWATEAGLVDSSPQTPATSPTEAAPSSSSPSGGGADEGGGGGQTPDDTDAPESPTRQARSWHHAVVVGALAALVPLAILIALAVLVDVPTDLSEMPWYLLGLQPFLGYLEPFIALVVIPGVVLAATVILAVVAWSPAVHPSTRRLALMMLVFIVLAIAALTVLGALQA